MGGTYPPTPGRRLPWGLCARRRGGTTYLLRAVDCPRACVLVDGVNLPINPGPLVATGPVGPLTRVYQPTYSGPSVATGPACSLYEYD